MAKEKKVAQHTKLKLKGRGKGRRVGIVPGSRGPVEVGDDIVIEAYQHTLVPYARQMNLDAPSLFAPWAHEHASLGLVGGNLLCFLLHTVSQL